MLALKVTKPQTKVTATPAIKDIGKQRGPEADLSARKAPGLSWDFSKIAVSAPDPENRTRVRSPLSAGGRWDARPGSTFGHDFAAINVRGDRPSGRLPSAQRGTGVAKEGMRAGEGEGEDGEGLRQVAADGADGAHVLANPPPRPDAVARALTPEEMADALDYNSKALKDANEISILRNAVGAPAGDTVDEDFVRAIVQFQAVSDIHQDGKLGPTTSGRLSRELRAEARPLGREEATPLRQAARQRDRYSFNISVIAAAAELTNTGSAEYRVRWSVPDPTANGWIVQHVRFTGEKFNAAGNAVATNMIHVEYWEGWQVRAGRVFVGSSATAHDADTFRTGDEGAGTRGQLAVTGRVTFLPNFNLQEPPWGHTVPQALALPTVTAAPPIWSDGFARLHRMQVTWNDTIAPATHSVTATP
jgi:hypothetical protein